MAVAPGTFGSVLGLGWFALLLCFGSLPALVIGTFIGLALSVWLCGEAERELGRKDPPSVVLDEISAMPICFGSWVGLHWVRTGNLPSPGSFLSKRNWLLTLAIFAGFRLFDIWKPWPVRQSQTLPAGWGVTVDDVLAALYVCLATLLVELLRR